MMQELQYDSTGDVLMTDIEDEKTVNAITQDLSRTRQSTNEARRKQPFDALRQALPTGIELIFVIDTNFIVSHLSIVRGLVEKYGSSQALVLIPWVVIQELDGLKSASSSYGQANLATLSRAAVRFIHDCLSAGTIGLRGQKIVECIESEGQRGDDAILDCARYWFEKQKVPVILLSNDKNLCTKMMIHGIDAISHELGLSSDIVLQRAQVQERKLIDQAVLTGVQAGSTAQSDCLLDDEMLEQDLMIPPSSTEIGPVETGLIEMQTDPILAPLYDPKTLHDPFAALSAKAGIGRYERNTRSITVRGRSPDNSRLSKATSISTQMSPVKDQADRESESQNHDASKQNSLDHNPVQLRTVLEKMHSTILKTFPDLILNRLLKEFDDLDAVMFLMGDLQKSPSLISIAQVLSDNWTACFSRLFPSYGKSFDTEIKHLARLLEQTLRKDEVSNTAETSALIKGWIELWRGLSSTEEDGYRTKRDRIITRWLHQIQTDPN